MRQISRRQVLCGILGGLGALLGVRAGACARPKTAPAVNPPPAPPVPVTDSLGSTTTYVYDGSARLVSIQGGPGAVMTYTYDASGSVVHEPFGRTTTVVYSAGKRRRA